MKLEEKITAFEYYNKEFNTWEAKKIIIDDKKAYYELRKKVSEYQKVCMFADGKDMIIYGDYGQYVFDKMTWIGSPMNLQYDNLYYQNEKASRDTRDVIYPFDSDKLKEDLLDWFYDRIDSSGLSENEIEHVKNIIDNEKDVFDSYSHYDMDYIIDENPILEDFEKEMTLLFNLFNVEDESEYYSILASQSDFDYEDGVYNLGKSISQCYLVSLLAMKICGEKLEEEPVLMNLNDDKRRLENEKI